MSAGTITVSEMGFDPSVLQVCAASQLQPSVVRARDAPNFSSRQLSLLVPVHSIKAYLCCIVADMPLQRPSVVKEQLARSNPKHPFLK